MKLILIAVFTTLILFGCGKSQEIKLLSSDNSHMLYLYPENNSAELYTGMSMIGEFELSLDKNTYTLKSKKDNAENIELVLNSSSGTWICSGCKKMGLNNRWLKQ